MTRKTEVRTIRILDQKMEGYPRKGVFLQGMNKRKREWTWKKMYLKWMRKKSKTTMMKNKVRITAIKKIKEWKMIPKNLNRDKCS